MPPGSTARPPPPAAETVANHGAESSSREYAQPAAGWCRSGSQNPARSSRCDRLAVGHAAVRTAPSPHSDRVAAPTAARKTAARLASSARINRPRNSLSSFISARKCWKCSLIGIIFAIGCRSPFQERLSLVRQSQLTPSRLLHNQRYVTFFMLLSFFHARATRPRKFQPRRCLLLGHKRLFGRSRHAARQHIPAHQRDSLRGRLAHVGAGFAEPLHVSIASQHGLGNRGRTLRRSC